MPCCRCKACGCFFVEIWWALCFWRHSWPSTLTCVLVQCPDSLPPGMPLSWICAMLCAIGSGYCTWYIGAISIVGRQPDLSHQSLVNGDQPIIEVVCIYIYIHMQCVWINDRCIVYGICIYCTDYIYTHVFSIRWVAISHLTAITSLKKNIWCFYPMEKETGYFNPWSLIWFWGLWSLSGSRRSAGQQAVEGAFGWFRQV